MKLSASAKKTISRLGDAPKMGDIKKIAKEIKIDHDLALELWPQGGYHPRLLAALIFDKKQLTEADFEKIANDLLDHVEAERNYISDWLLANQIMKDKKLTALLESWKDSSIAILRRWFWYHQGRLRWTGKLPPEGASAKLLDSIETDLKSEEPSVQWAMNFCAAWIGIFEPDLRQRCVDIGTRAGLYKDEKPIPNCTPNYLPEFIRIEVEKRA